ncbi:zinc protease [Tranquillimonas rosea]|uniref:Zinc protease n=1 Tax=Tranquillimonas rosea TaxID=641238 RepID=A0A1H9W8H2_9RHOB|nr:pitrilysin family protein [Tranquillimonas rosea]SES29743.1 zinc protease [Tranquillimonas rosea]
MIRIALAACLALATALPARAETEVQQVTSPGGIDAWLVEEHSIPFVALELRFRGGSALDPEGKRGAVNLMTATLEEGAADMDAQAFAAAREALAARFSFDAHDDAISVSTRFLTENRDKSVELLRKALVEPRFDEEAVERVRGQVLSNIRSEQTDPNAIARDTWDKLAFGDHPYATDSSGTVDSVTGLTSDDMRTAHDAVLARDRIYVSAVGDITPDELGTLLDNLLGDLPEEGAPLPDEAEYGLDGGVEVVDFDTPQSVIRFGHEGLKRDDPDFLTAYVVNQIFGGSGFESRLMEEVRVERGLTYGIGTALAPYEFAELVLGQSATANARAGETVEVIREEWRRLSEEGVTQDELDAAKKYLTGAYPLRFDGNARIADILVGMQMDDLSPDYIENRNDMVEAITLDEANRVARELYDPEALQFVVVGQPEGLDAVN